MMELYLQTLVVFKALCVMNEAQGQLDLYLFFQTFVENIKVTHEVMKSSALWKDI
jgi:hypothetical protein